MGVTVRQNELREMEIVKEEDQGRMNQIVDIHGLSEALSANPHTLRKRWRELPHFFVGTGRNLKSARFDVVEVLGYLKAKGHPGNPKREMGSLAGIQDMREDCRVGGRKARKISRGDRGTDPYHLLG